MTDITGAYTNFQLQNIFARKPTLLDDLQQQKKTENDASPQKQLKAGDTTNAEIMKAAKDFEAVFISQFIGQIYQNVGDDILGSSHAGGVYKSFLIKEYGKNISENGGFGIAEQVYRELLQASGLPQDKATQFHPKPKARTPIYGNSSVWQ